MPAKEIKELRQTGKLEEALAMAQDELNAQPDNIWGKRNISWVYYEYLKKYIQENNFEGFIENLNNIKSLNLPKEEAMIFDTSAFQIGSLVFGLQKTEPVDYGKINEVFEIIKDFHFIKPSESYSFLYKAFHKGYQNWSRYLEFADWWNFENLRPEDFLEEEFNGKTIMSVAEQAYIAYSKKLLEGEPLDAFGQQRVIDKEKIQSFLPKLDSLIDNHPDYQYPPYFKAKLLLASGSDENVLSAFLPFAKQKRNDFWVWELMAEILSEDKDIQFACYCKALSLKTPEDFLVKLRLTFAELLVEKQMYNEAKTEISKVIVTRERKGWKLSNNLVKWTESSWYVEAEKLSNNKMLYESHRTKAEELLYSDLPEHLVVVEFVNQHRSILTFVKDKSMKGFFNYEGLVSYPQIGDVLKVRMEPVGNEGFYKAFIVKTVEDTTDLNVPSLKEVFGAIKIAENKGFGFIEDVFVPPNLIKESSLLNEQEVKVKAVLSFDKSKEKWGWKACHITTR